MSLPKLSVVVPNYNHGKYLPRCLDALFGQSVPPFEIIVVDDASTDDSVEVLSQYARKQPKLRVMRNGQNMGAVKAALRGMEATEGDYLFLPSADDEIVPGLFEHSLKLLAQHPQAALSCTVTTWYKHGTNLRWHMGVGMAEKACFISPDELVRVGQRGKLPIPTSSVIFRKEPLQESGGFLPELRWHADWYASAVPAFRYGICYIPEPLSNVYLTPASFSRHGMRSEDQRQVLLRLTEKLSSPANADVAPRIRDSAALAMFRVADAMDIDAHATGEVLFDAAACILVHLQDGGNLGKSLPASLRRLPWGPPSVSEAVVAPKSAKEI